MLQEQREGGEASVGPLGRWRRAMVRHGHVLKIDFVRSGVRDGVDGREKVGHGPSVRHLPPDTSLHMQMLLWCLIFQNQMCGFSHLLPALHLDMQMAG